MGSLTHTVRHGETLKESVEVGKIAVLNFFIKNNLAKDFTRKAIIFMYLWEP